MIYTRTRRPDGVIYAHLRRSHNAYRSLTATRGGASCEHKTERRYITALKAKYTTKPIKLTMTLRSR